MQQKIYDDPIAEYFRLYPEEEDDMEGYWHGELNQYLKSVLEWYYRFEQCLITSDLIMIGKEVQAAPDVALIKEVSLTLAERKALESWRIEPPLRPAPTVAFEVSSKNTWTYDVKPEDKPQRYGKLGTKEYFAYDPLGVWTNSAVKLRGWRYDAAGNPTELALENGRLWSMELDSWLVPDGDYLRLYETSGNMRLTEKEADARHAQSQTQRAELEAQRADVEARRAESETQRAEVERQKAEAEAQQAQLERQRAEVERQRAEAAQAELEALLKKLKAHNIDPDRL